jgi:hypothetical protein
LASSARHGSNREEHMRLGELGDAPEYAQEAISAPVDKYVAQVQREVDKWLRDNNLVSDGYYVDESTLQHIYYEFVHRADWLPGFWTIRGPDYFKYSDAFRNRFLAATGSPIGEHVFQLEWVASGSAPLEYGGV